MSRKAATTSRPIAAARIAWWSELLPSVAVTSVRAICLNWYGSEPLCSTSAVCVADDAQAEIPLRPVDERRRVQLAVEDDRVVPGVLVDDRRVAGSQNAGDAC